jgi:hypothetical protein
MPYDNFYYWISGLCQSFGILKRTRRLKNWCFGRRVKRRGQVQWLSLALCKGLPRNWIGVPHLFTWGRKQIQVPKRFILFRIPDDGQVKKSNNRNISFIHSLPTHLTTHPSVYTSTTHPTLRPPTHSFTHIPTPIRPSWHQRQIYL